MPHDNQQHERANPERQIDEQRRHGKAVDFHFVELFGHNRCRRTHEIRNSIGVERAVFHKRRNSVRARQTQKAHFQRGQVARKRLKQTIGLAKCTMRISQRAIKGVQNGFCLVDEQLLAGRRCLELSRSGTHVAQTLRYRGNHGAEKRFRALLQRRDCSLQLFAITRRLRHIFQCVQRGERFVHGLHGHGGNIDKRLLHLSCFLGNFSQVALHRIKRLARLIKGSQRIRAHILSLVDGVVDIRELRARLSNRKNCIVYLHRCFGATLAYGFLGLAERLSNCLNHNIAHCFHERGIDGFLKRGGAGIGDFRGHRTCFHIHVILDVRLLEIARKQREKIFGEVFGDDEHRIIASRLKIGHGGIVISELPVQLVIFMQRINNERTHVKIPRKLVRSALVLVDHRHAHVARVVVGVPKAQHVVPRIQRGQN